MITLNLLCWNLSDWARLNFLTYLEAIMKSCELIFMNPSFIFCCYARQKKTKQSEIVGFLGIIGALLIARNPANIAAILYHGVQEEEFKEDF